MNSNLTKIIGKDFKLNEACEIVAGHWVLFQSGISLTLDLKDVAYIDPTIVALFLLVEDYYPGKIRLINPSSRTSLIIQRVRGVGTPGTVFPAKRIRKHLDVSLLENLKYYISYILNNFYNAPQNSSADFVELTAVELINNIIDHSDARKGGTIVAASFKKRKHFELSVIDFGNTIPGTLEHLFPDISDKELIAKALDFGVSRRYGSEHNYGRGLDIVKSYSLNDKDCSLIIISRNGFVSITKSRLHVRDCNYNFPGTLVKCSFSETFVRQHLEFSDKLEELEF